MWHIELTGKQHGGVTVFSLDVKELTPSGNLRQEALLSSNYPGVSGGLFEEPWQDFLDRVIREITELAEQSLEHKNSNSK